MLLYSIGPIYYCFYVILFYVCRRDEVCYNGFLLIDVCNMFFSWFFCVLLSDVVWASNVDEYHGKVYLNLHNNTMNDISIRIEKSCVPIVSVVDKSSLLLKKNSNLKIEYDVSVTNCLIVAPYDKEFGSDISLFVLDSSRIDVGLGFAVTSCDVEVSLQDRSHHLQSDCLEIKKI